MQDLDHNAALKFNEETEIVYFGTGSFSFAVIYH